jgi:poly(A) polymerase
MISSCCGVNPANWRHRLANGDFIEGDAAARESLLSQGGKDRAPKKRRRRSSNAKSRRPGDGMEGGASTVEGSARDNREERDVRDVRYGDESGGQRDD